MAKREEIVALYRGLLRHLNRLPSTKERTAPIRLHVLSQFRAGIQHSDPLESARSMRLAQSYNKLVSSVKEVAYLRSLDSGDKLSQRETMRVTAAKVGFVLPKFFEDLVGPSAPSESASQKADAK